MESMKRFKKITAGLMSFALVLGAVGTIPAAPGTMKAAAEMELGAYEEYYFQDVYVADTLDFYGDTRFRLVPKVGGYYNTWYDSYIMDFELDYISYSDMYDKIYNLFEQVENNTVISIRLRVKPGYSSFLSQVESGEYEDYSTRDTYIVKDVVRIDSPGVHYYGDINDDGVVDSFDLITFRKCLADKENQKALTSAMFANGDINRNDEIDDDDLKRVSDYLLGNIDEFYGDVQIGSVRLDNTVNVEASEGMVTDEAFANAEMKFGVDLLKNCFDPTKSGEENLLISPLSISSALAMTANGADGNTRAEMEKVLGSGLTLDQINEYMAYYAANLPDTEKQKIYLANSIWFRDDPSFQVYDSFLETNKKFYNSEIYKTAFDDSTVDDVNGWVNNNTRGMIPTLLRKGALNPTADKIMMMMLINTLYFEADWATPYTDSYDGKFIDLNGNEHDIKRMASEEREYFDLGDADAFKKYYSGSEYSFVGILPKEKNIVDYINDLDAEKLIEGLKECEDPDTVELHVMIPKFKYNYSKSLSEVLSDMGMPEAFDVVNADFSKINDLSVPGSAPLYIDDVLHKTRIEVTEKGTKAAAVTAVMMAQACAVPPEKKKVYIELDRPFVYMIVDKNNVPVFIGAATQIEEN